MTRKTLLCADTRNNFKHRLVFSTYKVIRKPFFPHKGLNWAIINDAFPVLWKSPESRILRKWAKTGAACDWLGRKNLCLQNFGIETSLDGQIRKTRDWKKILSCVVEGRRWSELAEHPAKLQVLNTPVMCIVCYANVGNKYRILSIQSISFITTYKHRSVRHTFPLPFLRWL
jgi:hypothetical protein